MWPFRRSRRNIERKVGRIVLGNAEARSSLEDPRIPLSDPQSFAALFGAWQSASGVEVTPERALGVPAIWCAVNFIAGTIASLPLNTFAKKNGQRVRIDDEPSAIALHDRVNADMMTSFAWRKYSQTNTLLRGRSLTYIERLPGSKRAFDNLWPLNPLRTYVELRDGRMRYRYRGATRDFIYEPKDIIDIPFMLSVDGIAAVDPMARLADAVGLAIALERYASKFFLNGGVPPLAMQMPAGSTSAAARRAATNIEELIRVAQEEGRLVLPMPAEHRLEQVGYKPQDGQLIDARKFQLTEIARVFMLPPIFLQDLERGTYSNTEQQDLHFVKHTLTQWLECWEQELNAKLYPDGDRFVEFNQDGLLRGDFASRMDGYAKAIQNAIRTPDECRDLENLPRQGGDAAKLHIQSATVPLGSQPQNQQNLTDAQKRAAIEFLAEMATAFAAGDAEKINAGFADAAAALRRGDPLGEVKTRVLIDLHGMTTQRAAT